MNRPRVHSICMGQIYKLKNNPKSMLLESIIIEKDGTKKLRTDMGESFMIYDDINDIDEVRESEMYTIDKQNSLARYRKTKKYIAKGSEYVTKGKSIGGALYTVWIIGKYILPFLI